MNAPFKFLDAEELEALLMSSDTKTLKDVQSVDGNYHMFSHVQPLSGGELLIFQYYVPSLDDEDDEGVLPDNIWSRIFIGPSFGEGTQVLQHGMLTFPLIVVNEHNANSIVEIVNDGIVAFEVNGDRELAKNTYLWMKKTPVEGVFQRLGEEVIAAYMNGLMGGEAKKFLINTEK
jgi:hypothetical protein